MNLRPTFRYLVLGMGVWLSQGASAVQLEANRITCVDRYYFELARLSVQLDTYHLDQMIAEDMCQTFAQNKKVKVVETRPEIRLVKFMLAGKAYWTAQDAVK